MYNWLADLYFILLEPFAVCCQFDLSMHLYQLLHLLPANIVCDCAYDAHLLVTCLLPRGSLSTQEIQTVLTTQRVTTPMLSGLKGIRPVFPRSNIISEATMLSDNIKWVLAYSTSIAPLWAIFLGLFVSWFISKLAFRAYTNPLSKLPGPWHTRWTDVLEKYYYMKGRKHAYVHELHQKYGL
jgi:hypothetical protein